MIRCIAIDDEPMALDKLKNYIEKVPFLELVALCECAADAVAVMETETIDAMFVDVNMPDIDGMEFVRSLQSPPMVVFTTAYSEFAVESYKVQAVDYLLKPFGFDDFKKAADKLNANLGRSVAKESPISENIFLKVDYRYVRVTLKDIIYVEGMNEYLKFHIASGDPLLCHTTFRNLIDSLPENFLQVHRSYVVNMNHVRQVEKAMIEMSNGNHIPISDSNKDAVMQYLYSNSIRR